MGRLNGYPRVYGIAWALIAHTDSAFDLERLERFVRAYQDVDLAQNPGRVSAGRSP